MNSNLHPFSCSYSPQFPELLHKLNCSLAVSTYQAGKVIFISPKDENTLIQLPRSFSKAMGIYLKGSKLAIATKDAVQVLVDSPELAEYYPRKPSTYDSLFMPRATYYTGALDLHDIALGKSDEIYAVNTSFSCLIKIDDNFSFTPIWKPPFITKLASEDRCHLNGMALEDQVPKYFTAFNQGNEMQSWRKTLTKTGILIDKESNEIIAQGLAMPHSPRIFDGEVYLLLSATGDLAKVDFRTGKHESIFNAGGFVRGLAKFGDYVFIGISRLRKNSSTFAQLDIAKHNNQAGIIVLHLPTGSKIAELRYQMSVDEIYDIQVLPNRLRPGILNTEKQEHQMGLSIPKSTYWARPNI